MSQTAWSYSGSGEIKLLYGTSTYKTRVVMRDASTQKVLMNHFVQPEADLRPAPSEADDRSRAFSFTADDGATGVLTKQVFAVRFKAENAAREFEAMYKQAQIRNERSENMVVEGSSASFALADVSVGSVPEAAAGALGSVVLGVSASPLPGILESPPQSSHSAPDSVARGAVAPGVADAGSRHAVRSPPPSSTLLLPAEFASPTPVKAAAPAAVAAAASGGAAPAALSFSGAGAAAVEAAPQVDVSAPQAAPASASAAAAASPAPAQASVAVGAS